MSLSMSMDFQYKTSIEKLWSALTESGMLAKWIADNDFEPIVGHRFQFRMKASRMWDGIIEGEVLIVEPPNKLSYTFGTGEEIHTVTWTLQELGDGKVNLHLEQTGFSNRMGVMGAKFGWRNWSKKLKKALAQ